MRRWIELWNAYWFPEGPSVYLAVSRIVAVAAQLFWFFPSLDYQLALVEKNREFMHPQILIRAITAIVPREALFTPEVLAALYWITMAAGLTALIGLFTRTSLLILAAGIWLLVSHAYSYADVHHPEALFAIFLVLLACSPSGERLSLDALIRRRRGGAAGGVAAGRSDMVMWPLKLIHVLLALTYFSTGITKILSGGLEWMNGYTLQAYLFADGVRRGIPLGIWLAQQHTLAILLSVFTIGFELFFFVSLLLPRTAPLFFAVGILFHVGLFVASGHPFFQHITLLFLLLLFIEPSWWRTPLTKFRDAPRARWRRQEARQAV